MSRRVALTTFGSLGDLHPFLATAKALRQRGCSVVLATSARYREAVEAEGIEFAAVSPDIDEFDRNPERIAYLMDERKGPERLTREVVMPHLREAYDQLLPVAKEADVLVTHSLTFAARLVAEQLRVPWISTALQPMVFFSRHDPAVLAPAPWLSRLDFLGPGFRGLLNGLMRRMTREWAAPWHQLRRELGLPEVKTHPMFEGQFSPHGTLALFSTLMARPQADWPVNTVITGFPFHDTTDLSALGELQAFLAAGPPPLVFTRGSAAVYDAEDFFEVSLAAAKRLGQRALFTVGNDVRNQLGALPDGMLAVSYAPFSVVFPAASVTVHQCGIGTCGQALAAGKPMLLVPHAFDQPDNAARLQRLGVGRMLGRRDYTVPNVEAALGALLGNEHYRIRAGQARRVVAGEEGAGHAADAILRLARG